MHSLESVDGVGPAVAKKLRDACIFTAELLAVQNPCELVTKTGLGEGICKKIVRSARQVVGTYGFMSGLEVEKTASSRPRLKTGVPQIDAYLLGGIESGTIVELYGPARGGKTQWCAQFSVMAQMPPEKGGLGGRVLWLDTESSFEPHVIRGIAYRFGLDPDVVLGNIGRAKVVLSSQMAELFESIPRLCVEDERRLRIIDSLTGLFRAEYTGLDQLRLRQADLNGLLNQMRRVSAATGAIFVYTNQVMANISPISRLPIIPVGGHVLAHGSDYRFYTRRTKDDIRHLELQDNAGIPEFEFDASLGWGGLYSSSAERKSIEPQVLNYLKKIGLSIGPAEESAKSSKRGRGKTEVGEMVAEECEEELEEMIQIE